MEHLTPKLVNFASILEEKTKAQAFITADMPFVKPHLALMPDAHLGKGATVGSVIPTQRAIMPAAVGVDIGCGMIAKQTNWTKERLEEEGVSLRAIREGIERRIPLSAGNYNTTYYNGNTESRLLSLDRKASDARFRPSNYASNWELQLGTLGSGNHFIEVSLDQDDRVWFFLHSGSRGVGNKIAQNHIKVAQGLMEKYFIDLEDRDLAYLVEGTDEFWAYIRELMWAQEFARLNREEMMERVEDAFAQVVGERAIPDLTVNCHHNYTQREKHFGKDVWLSRKGAISAKEGEWGLIPGSMGTRSYVVQGKGFRPSFCSAPHGAGREYSRSAARKAFTMEDLEKRMEGIEYRVTDAFIDEIPDAYKPIDVVMQDAKDLVEIKYELRQIVNVKGD